MIGLLLLIVSAVDAFLDVARGHPCRVVMVHPDGSVRICGRRTLTPAGPICTRHAAWLS